MTTNLTVKKTLAELYALWEKLGNVPTDSDGENLDEPFLHFTAGTPREDVWHWFEAQNPGFVVGDVMQGIRRLDAPAAPAVDTQHWAYQQGRLSGLAGDTTERGIMAFGLGFAGDTATANNTRMWIAGFDAGVTEAAQLKAAPPPANQSGDIGEGEYGQGS